MGSYLISDNYSLATWYENTGAFDLNTGTDLLLDLTRDILASDNYVCQLVAFPKGQDVVFTASGQSFSGSLNLVPYSYIVGLMGYNNARDQFNIRIYDKGAQTDLYYGQFALFPTVAGIGQDELIGPDQYFTASSRDIPFGPYFFRAPWIIVPPGILQIQVTNSVNAIELVGGTSPFFLQMLFLVAVPKTSETLNNRRVISSTDQSGLQSLLGLLANTAAGG